MKKRGMSQVVAIVLLILIVVMAIIMIWLFVLPFINGWLASAEMTSELIIERLLIPYVGKGDDSSVLKVEIRRGKTDLMRLEIENVTFMVPREVFIPTDVLLLVDLSGSMRDVVYNEGCVNLAGDDLDYAGSYCEFSVAACTDSDICDATHTRKCENINFTKVESYCNSNYGLCDYICDGDFSIGVCEDISSDSIDSYCSSFGTCNNSYICDGDFSIGECVGIDSANLFKDASCSDPDDESRCGECGGSSEVSALDILKDSTHDLIDIALDHEELSLALMSFPKGNYEFLDFTKDKDVLNDRVDIWEADGGTPIYDGLNRSYNEFKSRPPINASYLIVFGDGAASYSNSDFGEISQKIYDENVSVSTIGFGPKADTDLFKLIAGNGGQYYDSSDFSNLTDKFEAIIEAIPESHMVKTPVSLPGVFIDIAIFAGGDSYIHRIDRNLPGANEGRTYEIPLKDGWKFENVTKVEVYIVAVSSGGIYNSVLLGRYKM